MNEKTNAPPLYMPGDGTSNNRAKLLLTGVRHTFVWCNGQSKVEEIGGISEGGLPSLWQVQLSQI